MVDWRRSKSSIHAGLLWASRRLLAEKADDAQTDIHSIHERWRIFSGWPLGLNGWRLRWVGNEKDFLRAACKKGRFVRVIDVLTKLILDDKSI